MERLISCILVVCMLASMLVTTAMAGPSDPLTLTDAVILNGTQVLLVFSEPVNDPATWGTFNAIRLVDNDDNLMYTGSAGAPTWLQFGGTVTYQFADINKNMVVWTKTAGAATIYDMLNKTGPIEEDGWADLYEKVRFCIEQGGGDLDGQIHGVTSADGSKLLQGRQWVDVNIGPNDRLYADMRGAADITYTAQMLSESRIRLSFSEAVDVKPGTFFSLRYVDENNALQWSGEANVSIPLQWSGDWAYENDAHTSIIWTIHKGHNKLISEVLNFVGSADGVDFSTLEGVKCKFGIEEGGDPGVTVNRDGHVTNVLGRTGNLLQANNLNTAWSDASYVLVSPVENPCQIKSVSTISSTKLLIQFTEPVEFSGSPYMALRIVDDNNNLQWRGEPEAEGSAPMQLDGAWEFANKKHDSIIWKAGSGVVSHINEFIERKGAFADFAEYKTMFCIEEIPTTDAGNLEPGLIDNITGKTSGSGLYANKPSLGRDGVYADVVPFVPSLFVESVEPYSAYQLRITFTEPVDISGSPFMALRLVDANNNLQWTGEPEAEGSEPLQWSGSWAYENSDRTSIIWTLHSGILASMNDAINRTGALADFADYKTMFCIEELLAEDYDAEFGVIDNITSRSTGEKLFANTPNSGGRYERVYLPVKPFEPTLAISEVRAISPDKLRVQFSEPVDLSGDPFIALRFVDDNNQLQWTGEPEKSDPMQFYGTWAYESDKKDAIIWTLNGGGFFIPVDNVTDIINRTGNAWGYRHLKTKFCIEEVWTDPERGNQHPGTIDNIKSAATGEHLFANKPSMGLDGIYVDATPYYPSFYVNRVIAYTDKDILVEFSSPIRVKGAPFMALRIVDSLNNLQWDGAVNEGTPIQFSGTWKFADADHDRIIWTLADEGHPVDVKSVAEIINREGACEQFSGYRTRFCIEEKPVEDVPDTHHWAISNITNKYGTMLYANKNSPDGAWDGMYARVTIDTGFNPFTGGDANVWLCTSVAAVAVACGAALVILKKKRALAETE